MYLTEAIKDSKIPHYAVNRSDQETLEASTHYIVTEEITLGQTATILQNADFININFEMDADTYHTAREKNNTEVILKSVLPRELVLMGSVLVDCRDVTHELMVPQNLKEDPEAIIVSARIDLKPALVEILENWGPPAFAG